MERTFNPEGPEIKTEVKLENSEGGCSTMSLSESLLSDASIKAEISDLVAPLPFELKIKVEKVEDTGDAEGGKIDNQDFSPDPDYTTSIIKLENLPEAPEDFFVTTDAEIDIKDEFKFLAPLLESIKTEETPVGYDFQKPGTSPDLGSESDSNIMKRSKKQSKKVKKPLASRPKKPSKKAKKPLGSKHVCQRCKAPFARKEYLKRHELYHCENGPLQGLKIDPSTVLHGYFTQNLPSTSTNSKPQCKECGKYFSRPDCVKKHFARTHLNPKKTSQKPLKQHLICGICQKTFATKESLAFHFKRHTGENARKCKVCGETFGDSYAFNRHMRWAHYTPAPPKKCRGCGKVFYRSWDLKRHQERMRNRGYCPSKNRQKFGEKIQYTCAHCGYSCVQKGILVQHLQRFCVFPTPISQKLQTPAQKHTCKHCGYFCAQKKDLQHHLQLRGKFCVFPKLKSSHAENYECANCGRSFLRKDALEAHLQVRLRKPHKYCQACCKYFKDPKKRLEHLTMGQSCRAEVSSGFLTLENIPEKPAGVKYTCEHCGYSFSRREHLAKHLQLRGRFCVFPTPKGRPEKALEGVEYTCDHCGYSSFQKGQLREHLATVHKSRADLSVIGQENAKRSAKNLKQRHKCSRSGFLTPKNIPEDSAGFKYTCEHCGYFFSRREHLAKHLQLRGRFCVFPTPRGRPEKALEGMEYTCDYCGYASLLKGELLKHIEVCVQKPNQAC